MKTKLFTLIIIGFLFASCEEEFKFDVEYNLHASLSELDYRDAIRDEFTLWSELIKFSNYEEALNMTTPSGSFHLITSIIQGYEEKNNYRWFYNLDSVEIHAFQYNMSDQIVGAWIYGRFEYFEGLVNYTKVTDGHFYSSVIFTEGDINSLQLAFFTNNSYRPPMWWMNDTGNDLTANQYYIKLQ